MEISALDRANNTDRSKSSLTGAEADLFNQMLAGLTEIDETYGDDEPADDKNTEETAQAKPADDNEPTDQPDQRLALLTQGQTDQKSASTDIGADAGADTAWSNGQQGDTTDHSATPSGAETAQTTATTNRGAEVVAVVQPTTVSQQRVTTQTANENNQPNQEVEAGNTQADKTSLRADRDAAMAQGNGKLHGQPENNLAADKAKPAASTGEQTAQANQQTERLGNAADPNNQQQTARAEATAPEAPKTQPPAPPTPTVGTTTAPALSAAVPGPKNSTAAEQITQLTANARPGEAQALGTAKTAAAADKSGQASRQQPPAQQIAVHVRNGLKSGADSIHVRLHPAELGRVEVRMQIDGDKNVQAVITVETSEAMDSLQRDSRMLQRALADAGFNADSDSFTFEQNESALNQGDQTPGDRQTASGNPNGTDEEGAELESQTAVNRRSTHDGIVDIEV